MDLADRLRRYAEMIRAEACDLDVAAPSVAVVAALRTVPRHRFLERFYSPSRDPLRGERSLTEYLVDQASPDEAVLDMVYSDQALITRVDEEGRPTSSTSQPALVAAMLELLEARPGTRVLEIGAGTGYNAALLAELVEDPRLVTTVDIQSDVVEQTRRLLADSGYGDVRVLCRDGVDGVPEHAPFDRVVATVGCPDISWRWVEQLAPGGMMLIPLQHGGPGVTPLARLHASSSGDLDGRVVAWSGFMPLQGEHSATIWPASVGDVSGSPNATFDLPPALAEAPRTIESYQTGRRAWWDFAYFLALDDPRTHFGEALALVDPNGDRLILTDDHVALHGATSKLHDDLRASYQRGNTSTGPPSPTGTCGYFPATGHDQSTTPTTRPGSSSDPPAGN